MTNQSNPVQFIGLKFRKFKWLTGTYMNTKRVCSRSEPKKIAEIWKHFVKNAHKRQFLSDKKRLDCDHKSVGNTSGCFRPLVCESLYTVALNVCLAVCLLEGMKLRCPVILCVRLINDVYRSWQQARSQYILKSHKATVPTTHTVKNFIK